MLDWKCEIIPKQNRRRILLKDVVGSIQRENIMEISCIGRKIVGEVFSTVEDAYRETNMFSEVPKECDHVGSIMNDINSILNDRTFLQRLKERAELGAFCMSIGATSVHNSDFLAPSRYVENFSFNPSGLDTDNVDESKLLNELYDNIQSDDVNIDSIMSLKSFGEISEVHYSEEMQWVRNDPQAKTFLTTLETGPAWKDVTRRVTISLTDDSILEDIKITPENDNMSLHQVELLERKPSFTI